MIPVLPSGLPRAPHLVIRRLAGNRLLLFAIPLLIALCLAGRAAYAQEIIEEEVSFQSGDVTLHGTLLIPQASEPQPAIVLIHGAGLGRRDRNRNIAEALAAEGFIVLIYDKRTEGYSSAPVGQRSYSLLADDVIAAVHMLQQRGDVQPDQVGLWGLSEGGWVAPLAATRSTGVAFVIAVAGGGVGPAEQTAWATEGALLRQGVTSPPALSALADHSYRFFVSAELFGEGTYDPVPVLTVLRQPILGIWGAEDRTMPAVASARLMQQALDRSGHTHYVLRIVPDASHDLLAVSDGVTGGELAPGYVEMMVSWIRDVLGGNPPGPHVDPFVRDEHPTRPGVRNPQGFARWQIQLAFLVAFHLLFGGYFLLGAIRGARGAPAPPPARRRTARIVAALGLVIPWALYAYLGFISATAGESLLAVIAGRPAVWFILQLLTLALLLLTVLLAVSTYRRRHTISNTRRTQLGLILLGVILLVPWAIWWQLLSP